MRDGAKNEELRAENEMLRMRLEEAEATLEAIRTGEVDAVVVGGAEGQRIYTLEGADQFYRVLIEAMQQGAATLSADGTVLYCNRSFAAMLHIAQEKVAGTPFSRFVLPAGLPLWQCALQQAQARASQAEILLDTPSGEPLPVHLALNPLPLQGGLAVGLILTDLTDRKRQEQTDRLLLREETARLAAEEVARQAQRSENILRESEERFRTLAVSTPMIVWTILPDGRLDYASQRWFDMTGQVAEHIYGSVTGWLEALHPDDREQSEERYLRSVAAGVPFEMEVRFRRAADGAYRWHLIRAVPVYEAGGQVVKFVGTGTDIDDLKQAISEQKRVEDSLRFLADASASLAALVDWQSTLQKVATLAVPYFADWCAVDIAETDGSLRRLAVTHIDPTKVKLAHELWGRYPPNPSESRGALHVLRTGQSEMVGEIPDSLLVEGARDTEHLAILRRLGLKSYMSVPLKVRSKALGVLTFVSAESGRRYTASDLAFAEELARRAAVALENTQLYANLQETDRLKDEFLAMLAHELRNPLAPIRNSLHIMKQPGTSSQIIQQVREMAERQVQHMARLLDDLLDVSRISRGKIELAMKSWTSMAIVSRTIEAVRPFLEERRHRLTVSLAPSAMPVLGDPTRLEQIVTNLLNNSVKYTDAGGHISLTIEREAESTVLRVEDDGIGIAADMLPKIFDLFVQAERRVDRSQGGVGIGLTLVKRLVELHGGTIEARSPGLGQGSEFIVRLPLCEVHAGEEKLAIDPPALPSELPPVRVLVVDDNQDAADSLVLLLKLAGQEACATYNGPSALAQAKNFRPALVFLDIGMPDMDGYAVARNMRNMPDLEHVTLVALTGWGQDSDRERSREAGFNHHLVKPVNPAELQQMLIKLKRD